MNHIEIIASGGENFQVHADGEFLGSFEFSGNDEDEIIEKATDEFELDGENITVR